MRAFTRPRRLPVAVAVLFWWPAPGAARAADMITLPAKPERVVATAAAPDGGVNLVAQSLDWRGRSRLVAYGLSPTLKVRWRHRVAAESAHRAILAAGVAPSGDGVVLIARFRLDGPDPGVERLAFDRAGHLATARISSRRGDVTEASLAVAPDGSWLAAWTRELHGSHGNVALSAAAAPSVTAPPTRADQLAVLKESPLTLQATTSATGDALVSWSDFDLDASHAVLVTRDLTTSPRLDIADSSEVWPAIAPNGDALLVASPLAASSFHETDRRPKLQIFARPMGDAWWRAPSELEMPGRAATADGHPRDAAVALGPDGQALLVTIAQLRRTGRVGLVRGNIAALADARFQSFARAYTSDEYLAPPIATIDAAGRSAVVWPVHTKAKREGWRAAIAPSAAQPFSAMRTPDFRHNEQPLAAFLQPDGALLVVSQESNCFSCGGRVVVRRVRAR